VVSRAFFTTQPENHLTAPCCAECNRGFSSDEEYVRDLFCMSAGHFYKHPVALELAHGAVARSLIRNPKLTLRFAESAKQATLRGPGGILLPNQTQIDGDVNRIQNVMRKITRGLVYCYAKTRVPTNYRIEVDFGLPPQEFYNWAQIISQASRFGKQVYPQEVFAFTGAWNKDDPAESVWLFSFYKRFTVLAVTAKPKATVMVFADTKTGKPVAELSLAAQPSNAALTEG